MDFYENSFIRLQLKFGNDTKVLHYTNKLKIPTSFMNNTSFLGLDTIILSTLGKPLESLLNLHNQRNAVTVALEEHLQTFWCVYSGDWASKKKLFIIILDLERTLNIIFWPITSYR